MDYGVTITKGALPWQIFQQNSEGYCRIILEGEYHLIHLSQELPIQFSEVSSEKVSVRARILLERNGEPVVPWKECIIIDAERWKVVFEYVPAGGLYRIETSMEYEGWDGLSCTRGDIIHNIGVGDVFVIAGQSNAAGRAKGSITDDPELGVHVLRSSAKWELATHPLGDTTNAVHIGHYENHNPGHSPWLHYAKILKHTLGYPIGLVPCAYGGAPLRWWNPKENGALFENMLAMLGDFDLHPKAILWYQGEAEGYENSAETYLERFSIFAEAVREALNQEDLPFITVQLNRCMNTSDEILDRQWGMVREAQRRASVNLKNVAVIPASDLAMYDFIHISAEANLLLGERCAKAALAMIYGYEIKWKAPEPIQALQVGANVVMLYLSNIENWINPFEVPASMLPFEAEDCKGLNSLVQYEIDKNSIKLIFARAIEEGACLHGAWRMYPGSVIPCDCMRMPMLSFYGYPITRKE